MKYDDNLEKYVTAIFGIVGILAIVAAMPVKGLTAESALDAIKDFAGLAVTITVFLIAARISRNSKDPLEVAETALRKLAQKYGERLTGPQYDKDDYTPDSETPTSRMRYLFWKRIAGKYTRKVALIPLEPLGTGRGVLDIRVAKATLKNLGLKDDPDSLLEMQKRVREAVRRVLDERYKGAFTQLHPPEPGSHNQAVEPEKPKAALGNSAIVVDFEEETMGAKKYALAIQECGSAAIDVLLSQAPIK